MRRRDVIAGIGGAAAWLAAGRAQESTLPVVGLVSTASLDEVYARYLADLRRGLGESGFVEGRNISIEYHWLEGQYDRLPAVMADLVARRVAVIAVPGGSAASLAAKAATSTIPITFGVGDDPVKLGLVASLARPGGNATGINYFSNQAVPKRLGLLSALVPKAKRLAVLINPRNSVSVEVVLRDVQDAARLLKWPVDVHKAGTSDEIAAAFAAMDRDDAEAIFIAPDAYFNSRRFQLAALATRYQIAACYSDRDFVDAGGLMSYGTDVANMWHQVGSYAGRVLKGANPADLAVAQSTRFIFALNMKVAKTLDLDVTPMMRLQADVIVD